MNTTYDFAFSEQGYNHIKADKVCQDSSGHYSDDLMAVVVVADGHGSDNYPRTDRGSSFAVEATITAIREFVKTVEDSVIDISEDSDSYLEQLAKNILANWYAAVDADLEKYPFSEEELSKVSDKYKKRYMSGQRQEKAYGTTLIARQGITGLECKLVMVNVYVFLRMVLCMNLFLGMRIVKQISPPLFVTPKQ